MNYGASQLTISMGGHQHQYEINDLTYSDQLFTVKHSWGQLKNGRILTVSLQAKKPVRLVNFALFASPDLPSNTSMLVNGFQTWTQTRELKGHDNLGRLLPLSRPLLAPYGDYSFTRYPLGRSKFHSWSWTGFNKNDEWLLLGSCDESVGYTRFDYDYGKARLIISRDCQGALKDSVTLLKLYIGRGDEQVLWDEYSTLLPPGGRRQGKRCTGWTSWYNYYTKIDEQIINHNVLGLAESGLPFDVFQIDDGWQQSIGDWQLVNHKFPAGMGALARNIRQKGFRPGLWLAPFICEKNSELWKHNYDWVLKDKEGKPVRAGWNPGWSGWFYALDFYAPGFQTWLKEVFQTVFKEWGYQMVKLDFLYAIALLPHHGRSRGQIMNEAMEFIDHVCGENWVLGCGVPLGSAVGKVDYCRIGGDVAPYWEDRLLSAINYRERVSTLNSLFSTLHRHMLDRRLFRNDPDVFILRDGKQGANKNKLNPEERHTLFLLNNLLGGLVFLSDNISEYSLGQREQLSEMFPSLEVNISSFSHRNHIYTIQFQVGEGDYIVQANLSDQPSTVSLPPGDWFQPQLFILRDCIELKAHQTVCLRRLRPASEQPWLMGSSGHLWPGAQISVLEPDVDGWRLELAPHAAPHTKVWIGLPGNQNLRVNGREYIAQSRDGYHFIIV